MKLNNARGKTEPFPAYRARLLREHATVDRAAAGRLLYSVCDIVTLPKAGEDEKADEGVFRGLYRQLADRADGKRQGRTKGVPMAGKLFEGMRRCARRALGAA